MQDNLEGSRVHIDSIKLMAEATGVSGLTVEAATTISEETTIRLRQVITKAQKFMNHSNRTRLSCADINRSLRWSDCQPTYGYECNPTQRMRYSYFPEAQVFGYEDETVNLVERFKNNSGPERLPTEETLNEAEPKLSLDKFHQSSCS